LRAAYDDKSLSAARSRRRGSGLSSISINAPSARATTTAISSNAVSRRCGLAQVSLRNSETGTPSSFAAAATLAWCFVRACSTSVRSRPTQLAGTFETWGMGLYHVFLARPGLAKSAWRTMSSARRRAASSRERRSILPHRTGLSRADPVRSSMARSFGMRCSARCLTLIVLARGRIPRRVQQPAHTMSSRCSRNVLTQRPHVGHPNQDQEPPLGNFRRWTASSCSIWPSWTKNVVVSTVMAPSARRREIERLGRSSRYVRTTLN
jgi:hypothetical protein